MPEAVRVAESLPARCQATAGAGRVLCGGHPLLYESGAGSGSDGYVLRDLTSVAGF